MQINPENESPSLVYSLMTQAITPRPIAWVSTISPQGVPNLAPYSYFNGIGSKPAALMFSAVNKVDGSKKDTVRNIEANGEFVVNVVPFAVAKAMVKTSGDFDYENSEFEEAGLAEKPSIRVTPPSVKQSPIQFECELIQIVPVGTGPLAANVIIGKIVLINIEDRIIEKQGEIDPQLLDAIGRMGGRSYCRTTDRFEIQR
ncbi:MAG: flavin reductase family protein [Mariniblastus sp.]|nr:flavin reductase family protein [Mariniblastus sp.]